MGFGRNSFVGWGLESPWGTPVVPTKYAEVNTDALKAIRQRDPRPTYRGLDAREGAMHDAFFGGNGGFSIVGNYVGMLRLLEHMFGDSSDGITQVDVGVRWNHAFTLKDGLMVGKGLTLHMNTDTDSGALPQKRLAGFKVNQGVFSYAPDRPMILTINGAGKELDKVAVSTPTFPPQTEYVEGFQTTLEIDDVARGFDSCEITYDNGMDLAKRVLGSKNIAEPVRDNKIATRSVTVKIEMDAAEVDLTRFLAGTLIKIEVLSAGATLGTGNYRLDHTLLKCLMLEDPFGVPGPGIVKTTLMARALFPVSGETATINAHTNEATVS